MLPALNESGDLPAGVFSANWRELGALFGTGSAARERAFTRLIYLHELALKTGKLRGLYVFGSFVSAVPEPRDLDIILVMTSDFQIEDCPREMRTLFEHAGAQARYQASIFWVREGMLTDAEMREFMETWQLKRDGTKRGIVELHP